MKIMPVLAIALQMCVSPVAHAAHAASGTINFMGSIVEASPCHVTELGNLPSTKPQVSCVTREGLLVPASETVVKVSISKLPSNTTTIVDTMHIRQVVTMEYR